MLERLVATPRPVPGRLAPALAGGATILVALPVFLVNGWPTAGWVLAAVLWAAGQVLAYLLGRLPLGGDHLAMSGLRAIGMASRGIGILVVLLAVTVADRAVGVSAALLYVVAYTVELAVSLVAYFGSGK